MPKFKIVTHVSDIAEDKANKTGKYNLEMEALVDIDAAIVEFTAINDEEFIGTARDADVIFGNSSLSLNRTIIESLQNCKAIVLGSVGSDTVDVAAATDRGIPVTNVPDTFIEEVADHTMMLILATHRRVILMDKFARDGRWSDGRSFLYSFPRLMGQTLGFISFGHVARAVAKRAAPFGFRMLAYDPYIEELVVSQHGVEPVGLTELLQRSDVVSMHVPGMEETERMLREPHFRLMKSDALFISTGRGVTVDEAALIRALEEKRIAGAGLDVLEKEPPNNIFK